MRPNTSLGSVWVVGVGRIPKHLQDDTFGGSESAHPGTNSLGTFTSSLPPNPHTALGSPGITGLMVLSCLKSPTHAVPTPHWPLKKSSAWATSPSRTSGVTPRQSTSAVGSCPGPALPDQPGPALVSKGRQSLRTPNPLPSL